MGDDHFYRYMKAGEGPFLRSSRGNFGPPPNGGGKRTIGRIQDWIANLRSTGKGEFPFLRVTPEDNVLIGLRRIRAYLGIRSSITVHTWTELYGLPVVKRPDGQYMTTMTAIDQWLFLAAEVHNDSKPRNQAVTARLSVAKRRLEDRLRELEERRNRSEQYRTSVECRPAESETKKV